MISFDLDAQLLRAAAIAAAKDGTLSAVKIDCSYNHCELCATDKYIAVLFENVEPQSMPEFCGCLDAHALRNGLKASAYKAVIEVEGCEAVVTVYDKRMRQSCRFVAGVSDANRYPNIRRVITSDVDDGGANCLRMGVDKLEQLVKIAKAAFVRCQADMSAGHHYMHLNVSGGPWTMRAVGAQIGGRY